MQKLNFHDVSFVIFYTALFSLYAAGLLAITDYTLYKTLPDYQYSGHYTFGMLLFFIFGSGFTLIGRWRNWTNWRFFIIGALGIFFPIVFLASTIRLFTFNEGAMIELYAQRFCDGPSPVSICGEAFAASVFTMSLRALPTVITAPALYWYLLFFLPASKRRQPG